MPKTEILVLGPGCAACNLLAERSEQAAKELGLDYELYKFTSPASFATFGVMVTPSLVVNGEVKVTGRVPDLEQLKRMLS